MELTDLFQLDVLDDFDTIKIAIAYKVDGQVNLSYLPASENSDTDSPQELDSYPADLDTLEKAEVVYHEMPGWKTPTTNARTFYDLPKAARDYVEVRYEQAVVGYKLALTSFVVH